MPLSTSSFESTPTASAVSRKGIAGLLAIIVFALAGFEIAARFVVERKSKVQREVNEEYAEAIHIRRGSPSGSKQLLIVGNSLVGHGIDLDELRKDLPPNWQAHRFWIYATGYDDWYFGLRRLFAEGSRPDVVAVVFAAMHWNMKEIRGDYSAQYLFRTSDIWQVKSQVGLNKTVTSGLLLSRFSKAYALRTEIRKQVLDKIMPDLPAMYSLFKPGPIRNIPDEQVVEVATRRIGAYNDIVRQYGARLVLIVPPIPPAFDPHDEALRTAAARNGVAIAVPSDGKDLPPTEFADDIHLTPAGATRFTRVLAGVLKNELESGDQRKSTTE